MLVAVICIALLLAFMAGVHVLTLPGRADEVGIGTADASHASAVIGLNRKS